MGSKYQAYPGYKDSGIEWLGEIPPEWRIFRGKFVFSEYGERSETGDETLLSVSEYYGVKPRGDVVDDGDFLSRAESLVGYKKCNKNDLVMNIMLAWKRGLGVTKYDGIVSPAYSVFRFNENASPDYMHYLLRTDIYVDHFKTRSTGVIDSRLRLYPDSFSDVSILLPSINEQEKIANFLDHETAKIDTLIEKQQQLIKLLKEKRQAVISHAVTKGLNPTAKMRDSGVEWLGKVPEHWEVSRVGFYANKIGSGKTPKGGSEIYQDEGILFLRSQNIYDDGLKVSESECVFISIEIHEDMINTSVQSGDVLLNITGGSIGRTCLVPDEFVEANVNQHVCILRFAATLNEYLSYVMKADMIKEQIESCQTGSNREGLNFEQIAKLIVCIPPEGERIEVLNHLKSSIKKYDQLESNARQAIGLMQERRTALISAAVTGKIDVRDWQAPNG
ncbi:restriction endonuclease subunit S [Nitrosomonas ureae]|uniref:Type I restriction enzyme, S subunit n=1 Tax=Nitrosomonas ureae TaxID=44577 RepID=A0A1H9D4S3_9PROT|nr:restriction endonuclease subunit S [Nitrosomonas ureae]SEQ08482.1 type I restriction enzyme, S subunit [Nitrosomonas ureae]